MKKFTLVLGVILLVALAAAGVWVSSGAGPSAPDPVTVGQPALEQWAYIYVAQDRGFFRQNGLNVTIRDSYPNGVGPVRDMADGKIDLAVAAEYPVVAAILQGGNISVIATIDKLQTATIVARMDRGIVNISDLRGKKIGYPKGTIVEFFLGRFLALHGLAPGDVTLVEVNASHAFDAIKGGEVDAIAYFQPYVATMESRLGDNAVVWSAQSDQLQYATVSGRSDWVASHPEQVKRFLQALAEAQDYTTSHPDGAKAIVQRRLNLSDAYVARVWSNYRFSLSLDQSLLVAMNDEARWMIMNNLTAERTVPDFRQSISTRGLAEIRPASVDIR